MKTVTSPWPGADSALDLGDASEWDRVRLAGVDMPGLCTVSGAFGRKVHTKTPPGGDGATTTFTQYDLAEFEIRVRIWTEEHLSEYELLVPLIQPRPSEKSSSPVDIQHPALGLHGIWRVVVLRIGLLKPAEPKGVYETTIQVREWRPNKAKKDTSTTPLASRSGVQDGELKKALGGVKPSLKATNP